MDVRYPPDTEPGEALESLIHALTIRVIASETRLAALQADVVRLRAVPPQIAVIEYQLAELTKSRELWGQRGWVILMVGVFGVVTTLAGTVGALLAFYLNAKK